MEDCEGTIVRPKPEALEARRLQLIKGGEIRSLEVARTKYSYDPDFCDHKKTYVDETKAEVTCAKCGDKLNPIWVLSRLAHEESRYSRNRKQYLEAIEKFENKKRTKCKHCGKMTEINI